MLASALADLAFAARAAGEAATAARAEKELQAIRQQRGKAPKQTVSGLKVKPRRAHLEQFTRVEQWRAVEDQLRRDPASPLTRVLLLTECLEARIRAAHLGLPYRMGDRPEPFDPPAYPDDASLVRCIRRLSRRGTYVDRETLIAIADHIQTSIVDAGTVADHLTLLTAILSTGMPSFSYPKIVRALEKATATLSRTAAATRMQLAPAYHTLWTITLKPSYLNHFQQTLRHCYHTLADSRTYPGLGVDPADPHSLAEARRFLSAHRQSLWILNPNYRVNNELGEAGLRSE